MTGMGEDGAAGLGAIQAAGGFTIAQSPDTCVVDSMPRAAIERGFAARVVSLSGLASVLQSKCTPENASGAAGRNSLASAGGCGRQDEVSRRR